MQMQNRLSSTADEFTRFLSCRWLYQLPQQNHHVNSHFAPMLFVTSLGSAFLMFLSAAISYLSPTKNIERN
jgi:hypothetical protein